MKQEDIDKAIEYLEKLLTFENYEPFIMVGRTAIEALRQYKPSDDDYKSNVIKKFGEKEAVLLDRMYGVRENDVIGFRSNGKMISDGDTIYSQEDVSCKNGITIMHKRPMGVLRIVRYAQEYAEFYLVKEKDGD